MGQPLPKPSRWKFPWALLIRNRIVFPFIIWLQEGGSSDCCLHHFGPSHMISGQTWRPSLRQSLSVIAPPPIYLSVSTPSKYLDVSNWKVRVGSSKLDHVSSLSVAKIFVTKENALNSREKDIALVKLQGPLTFTGERRSLGTEPLRLSLPHPAKQAALGTSCSF